jgi:hypothetical protein
MRFQHQHGFLAGRESDVSDGRWGVALDMGHPVFSSVPDQAATVAKMVLAAAGVALEEPAQVADVGAAGAPLRSLRVDKTTPKQIACVASAAYAIIVVVAELAVPLF